VVAAAPQAVNEHVVRVAAHETWRGLRVLGSEVTLLFASDGSYLGFVGRFAGVEDARSDALFGAAGALAAIRGEKGADALAAERVVAPEHGTVAWELRAADRSWLVSETTGEVLARSENIRHVDESIVRRSVLRAPLRPQTRDWRKPLGYLGVPTTASTSVMKSYFDASHGACRYTLQSGLGRGTRNEAFPRVDDRSGGDDFVTLWSGNCTPTGYEALPCGMAFKCDADHLDGSYYRQQTYHSYLSDGLDVMRSDVHAFVPADSGWDVSLAIDEPLTGACGSDGGCFAFNPWHRTIFMTTYNSSVSVLWHELGHYFVWTYGFLGEGCGDVDESRAVNETLGDVFSSLLAKRSYDPRYSDAYDRDQFAFAVHSQNADRANFVAGTQGCNANGTYGMGEAFYQAMWEIAFGFNCDQAACDVNAVGVSTRPNPGDIAWTGNQQSAQQLLRAVAFALKTVGSGITFRQLAALIYIDLGNRLGGFAAGSTAAKAAAVFAHHGLM
jgi:hypothetical protein